MDSLNSVPAPSGPETVSEDAKQVQEVVLSYLQAQEAGQAPDPQEVLARHPHLASELRAFFSEEKELRPEVTPLTTASPPTKQLETLIGAQIGNYQILEELGRGGMGVVYKAFQTSLNRLVAIKVPRFDLPPEELVLTRKRFLREARIAAVLRHPNICPVYDLGDHEGRPYAVMAYIEGQSLARRLKEQGRFEDPGPAVELIRQMAEALIAVHKHGLTHRDLKPGNILLDLNDQALLTDFGLARPKDDLEQLTQVGAVVGTIAYMAPEQVDFERGPVAGQTHEIP